MIEFKSESWLEDHIINNFSKFFDFKLQYSQYHFDRFGDDYDGKRHDTIDLLGEDENNGYPKYRVENQ